MVDPLLQFRSRLTERERKDLDKSRMLTTVIRGFVKSLTIPPSSAPLRRAGPSNLPSTLTVISRLSSRRAGTRFNSRGIDDDGNVANFVETETILWSPTGVCFSYVQIRGSVPIFWESSTSLLPGQQKIQITRSAEATQPAFDKHFERLALAYGAVHIVNLLSDSKPGEVELTQKYRYHTTHSPLRQGGGRNETSEHHLLRQTEFDFHAETKGAGGYEGARAIRPYLETSADGFAYFMSEEITEKAAKGSEKDLIRRPVVVLQQEGVFRVNCLDCLDRTNLVQGMISHMVLEAFLNHRGEVASSDFWMRHSSLWADNGDALSKIYAGTGALKSSFTRHGKMSLAGAIADARKSATRLYVNNFADKGRQNTIDLLLGRLMGQAPVDLYDPVNDHVTAELQRRATEYTSSRPIRIWCGTFNLNGKSEGPSDDLSLWLCPTTNGSKPDPEIMVVGFQEIVELSPQQIMSTDPARRTAWERTVKAVLNSYPNRNSSDDYILLRSGQLVGAALLIFVKASVLPQIKNVEGSIKKTGMSGIAGNKGAVAIRLDYASTSLCFVTAHLAAGFANYDERNRDYKTISHGLRFQKNRTIEDHDSIIWLGDFNYRIGLSDDKARRLVKAGDLDTLYENDQLNIQMVAGMVFQYYSEARITFPPTYKFNLGTDEYDTSEKSRIPAWCDRILRKGTNLRQIDYNIAPLRFSDHKPVFATFECTITIVDESLKAALSKKLYEKRKAEVGTTHAAADGTNDNLDSNSDDEADLMGYESIAPELPPASSDRRKWWLDDDQPARSDLKPPGEGMVPNPRRAVNPWKGEVSGEPDWVDVRLPESAGTSQSRTRAGSERKPEPPPARRKGRNIMAPAWDGAADSRLRMMDNDQSITPSLAESTKTPPPPPPASRSLSRTSSASTTSTLGKKAPPPKPKKPSSLASPSSQTSTYTLASMSSDNSKSFEADCATTTHSLHPAGRAPVAQSRLTAAIESARSSTSSPQQPSQKPRPKSTSLNQSSLPPKLPQRMNTSSALASTSTSTPSANRPPLPPSPSSSAVADQSTARSTPKKVRPPPPPPVQHKKPDTSTPQHSSVRSDAKAGDEEEDCGPPLPPRRPTTTNTGLMDQPLSKVKGWTPLLPR
jgi:synaptojanin